MTSPVNTNGFNQVPPTAAQQNPGWVPNPAGTGAPATAQEGAQPPQGQGQQAATAPSAATPDMQSVVQLLQAALANSAQPPAAETKTVPSEQVGAAKSFDVANVRDPIIKSMVTAMSLAGDGVDLDRAIGRAVAAGDASLIDQAYLREAGGAKAAQLVQIAQGIVQAVADKTAAVTNEVYALVGGQANWQSSVAAFNQTAPHELRVTVAQMMDSTDEQFVKAGARIVAEFGKASGMIPQVGSTLPAAAAAAGGQGLSKQAFQAELAKLNPNSPTYAADTSALISRRAIGKRAGL